MHFSELYFRFACWIVFPRAWKSVLSSRRNLFRTGLAKNPARVSHLFKRTNALRKLFLVRQRDPPTLRQRTPGSPSVSSSRGESQLQLGAPRFSRQWSVPVLQQRLVEDQRAATGRFLWRPLLLHPLQFQAALPAISQPSLSCASGCHLRPDAGLRLMRRGDSEQTPISAHDDNSWA